MMLIGCRHSFVVYGVSKQHKHHSTYLLNMSLFWTRTLCNILPLVHLNTTSTHTRLHLTNGLVWRKGRPCAVHWDIVCISDINSVYFGVWWRRDWGSYSSLYHHLKIFIYAIYRRHTVAFLGEALYFKPKRREIESRWGYWEYSLTICSRPHCGSGVDTAYNTSECQGCLLGDKYDCV